MGLFCTRAGCPEVIAEPPEDAIIQPAVVTAPEPIYYADPRDLDDEEWQAQPSVPVVTPMLTRKQKSMKAKMQQDQIKMQKALLQGVNATPAISRSN